MTHKLRKNYSDFILPACSIVLILALLIASAVAWFAMRSADETKIALGMGKVGYTIQDSNKLFKNFFDIDGNYEDNFDPDDGYYPVDAAVPIGLSVNGDTLTDSGSGHFACTLAQNTMAKINLTFSPEGATDRILYHSSNSDTIAVSAYGTLAAIGDYNEDNPPSADITITLRDRTPDNPRADIVLTLTVTVAENTNPDATLGFLPENVNVLRNTLTALNSSTVDSKMRIKLNWEYYNYDENSPQEQELSSIEKVLVDNYITADSHLENILFDSTVSSPFTVTLSSDFRFVPAESGKLFRTANGCDWTIVQLSMTTGQNSQLTQFVNALAGNGTFTVTSKMIDEAYVYACYSQTDISSATADYGDAVPSSVRASEVAYPAVESIKTTKNYASFSTRQAICLNLTIQARQAAFFDEGKWFDVYTAGDLHTQCQPLEY